MKTALEFPSPAVNIIENENEIILSNALPLAESGKQTLLDKLAHWATRKPETVFLAQREGDMWRSMTYGEFFRALISTAQRLMSLGLDARSPLLILAPNSIDHATVAFAAMYIGVPVSPVSPAYALVAKTFERLQQVIDLLKPGAVYVSDAELFASSIDSIAATYSLPIIAATGRHPLVKQIAQLPLENSQAVEASRAKINPKTLAKIIFTSGSTGIPKGVLNTHEMMYSNQLALSTVWPFMKTRVPILVDWLPWSHTFGGNVSLNSVLFHGGTFYIDNGKPAPQLIRSTIDNIQHGRPSIHFNVPAGIEALLPFLESDPKFCRTFFGGLDVLFVAAAALPQKARDRLQNAALAAKVEVPKLLAGWGSTETAPFATAVYFDTERADNIGVPIPGTEIKLKANQDKLELSVRGPNVTTGYWNNQKASRDAFDDQGFYRMGDAGKLIDKTAPQKGIVFDGRISENFKLASGTWVNVGVLRLAAIDCLRPYCLDVVVSGHNQSDIGLILVPNLSALAKAFSLSENQQSLDAVAVNPEIIEALSKKIELYNASHTTSTTAFRRFSIIPAMPRIELNEITDKGYLNQRKLLESWQTLVAAMHALTGPGVMYFSR